MQLKLYAMILVFVLINFVPQPVSGNEISWRSIGLRGGVNDHRNDEDFEQYEGFSTWKLPWSRQWDSGWTIGTYLEANAGVLRGGGETAFVGSIGPGIYFSGFKETIDISMGINPTIISRHSHIGLNLNFARHFTIGYRLQHMSNGVLYDKNPGLNMYMLEVGYRF